MCNMTELHLSSFSCVAVIAKYKDKHIIWYFSLNLLTLKYFGIRKIIDRLHVFEFDILQSPLQLTLKGTNFAVQLITRLKIKVILFTKVYFQEIAHKTAGLINNIYI